MKARERLRQLGLTTKEGLLFHGPPCTGKTHTIHYLAGALAGTTTLLITADQVGNLAEYMTLARMLQPSLVVLEDVDLIARERRTLRSGRGDTAQSPAQRNGWPQTGYRHPLHPDDQRA